VRISFISGLGAGVILAVATACGGSSASQPPGQASQAAAGAQCGGTAGSGQAVAIKNFAFTPATVTVSANGTVTWANGDTTAHTVTFDNGPDCGNVAAGATVTATFSSAGTYAYHCTIHPSMKGSVTVS
jgi:plastocyanin